MRKEFKDLLIKRYKNPYKKHIPCDEIVWARLRQIKRDLGLHSINEVLKYLIKQIEGRYLTNEKI